MDNQQRAAWASAALAQFLKAREGIDLAELEKWEVEDATADLMTDLLHYVQAGDDIIQRALVNYHAETLEVAVGDKRQAVRRLALLIGRCANLINTIDGDAVRGVIGADLTHVEDIFNDLAVEYDDSQGG